MCRIVGTHGTSPLGSHFWEEGDIGEQGWTRDRPQTASSPACRYGRAHFEELSIFWCRPQQLLPVADSLSKAGEAGLVNQPPIPKWHANRTPIEIEEKVLYLRSQYHLGPMRIVWYLAPHHDIKISDATVSRMLKRNGVNRLPRGTAPEGSYEALQQAGTRPSYSNGR